MRWLAGLVLFGACYSKPGLPMEAGDGGLDGSAGSSANVIFVSSELVIPGNLGSVDAADAICQRLADAKGYSGTYVAYLSTSTTSAVDRILAKGSPSGWIRPDGKAVANSLDDLARGHHFYPVRLTEKEQDLYDSEPHVVTATFGATTADTLNTCSNYTSTAGNVYFGVADAQGRAWTELSRGSCGDSEHLYCVGISHQSTVSVPPNPSNRLVFVSRIIDPGTGRTGLNAKCADDASANGRSGTFVAGLATTNASIETWIPTDLPYARADGVVVFETGLAKMQAPVALDASKLPVDSGVATGARTFNGPVAAAESCQDWTSSVASDFVSVGWTMRSAPSAALFDHLGMCNEAGLRVFCFQTP